MKKTLLACIIAAAAITATAQTKVTVLEGARIIIGDGKTIDNATVVVQGDVAAAPVDDARDANGGGGGVLRHEGRNRGGEQRDSE